MPRQQHGQRRKIVAVGVALTLAVVAASYSQVLVDWERSSVDLRFKHAPRPAAPFHEDLVFVDIDDDALRVGGRWPWPRERLALALGEIAAAGAKTLVLDLLLVEPEGSRNGTCGPGDLALASVLARTGSVVAIELGDEDARAHGGGAALDHTLEWRLRTLASERGTLPALDDAIAALQPSDRSTRLSMRDREQIGALHAQERAWRTLASGLLTNVARTDDDSEPPFCKAPVDEFAAVARGAGFVNFTPDHDGGLRVISATRAARGGKALQLGLAAARAHLGLPLDAVRLERDAFSLGETRLPLHDGELWLVWPTPCSSGTAPAWLRCAPRLPIGGLLDVAETEIDLTRQAQRQRELAALLAQELGIGGEGEALLAAVSEEARFRLDDAAAAAKEAPLTTEEEAALEPFRDLLAYDHVQATARAELDAARSTLAAALRGKLVFVGWTATGAASDFVPTPLSSRTPGVVAHAVTADMVLSRRALHFAPHWLTPVATVAIGLLATLASLWPLWLATLASISLLAGWSALAGWLFGNQALVAPLVAPIGAGALAWVGAIALQAAFARRNQQRITRQFKARVAPELVDFLVDNPDALSMAGEPRDVTCFFVDLAGFTSLAEKLGAKETVTLLNRCMRAMTEALTLHGAYVNKYLGDGLMAFWSAFRPDPDQATRSCHAALAAQAALAKVIDRKQVAARMGLASGRVIVGDCGAPPLLHDYTAIGDAINLSARLESANKQFGTKILLDGATRRTVNDPSLRFRACGRVVVIGQTTPIDLFELVSPDATGAAGDLTDELIDATARAVDAFGNARRDEAKALFHELEARFGKSKLAAVYLDALADPEPLDGVLHLKSK